MQRRDPIDAARQTRMTIIVTIQFCDRRCWSVFHNAVAFAFADPTQVRLKPDATYKGQVQLKPDAPHNGVVKNALALA